MRSNGRRAGQGAVPVAFGTWHLGGAWGDVDEQQAGALLRSAVDRGVTVFDSARAYGGAEAILARALGPQLRARRSDYYIATKAGIAQGRHGVVRDSSPRALRESMEESLRTLGVEHIDLFQLHWPDPELPIERAAETFAAMRDEGKATHVGVCNAVEAELRRFGSVCPVDVVQLPYNILRREIEDDPLPYVRERGISVLAYGALSHGVLTDPFVTAGGFPQGDWRSVRTSFSRPGDASLGGLRRLTELARDCGLSLAQFAIAWTLRAEGADVAIVGAHNITELDDALTAAYAVLPAEVLAAVGRVSAEIGAVRMPPVFDDGKPSAAILHPASREVTSTDQGERPTRPVSLRRGPQSPDH